VVPIISVLFVDDESAILDICKRYLEQTTEFSVTTAVSASAALDLVKSDGIQAIVSDYQMTGMDGITFLKQVRAVDKTIPFILFTGRGREEIAVEAFESGADFYLQKGGDPASQFTELVHKIRTAVDHVRDEAQIATLNRLYSVISATNKAIIHIHDKKELLNEICRIAVANGGFTMAWAGLVSREKHLIEPVAAAGRVEGYLDTISLSTDDIPAMRGPTGTAFRTGTFTVCNDAIRQWDPGAKGHSGGATAPLLHSPSHAIPEVPESLHSMLRNRDFLMTVSSGSSMNSPGISRMLSRIWTMKSRESLLNVN